MWYSVLESDKTAGPEFPDGKLVAKRIGKAAAEEIARQMRVQGRLPVVTEGVPHRGLQYHPAYTENHTDGLKIRASWLTQAEKEPRQ